MFHFASRLQLLSILLGLVYAAPASDGGGEEPPDEAVLSFPRDEASLNEMFREVEELMEDTQYKLSNAVKEVRPGPMRGRCWGGGKLYPALGVKKKALVPMERAPKFPEKFCMYED